MTPENWTTSTISIHDNFTNHSQPTASSSTSNDYAVITRSIKLALIIVSNLFVLSLFARIRRLRSPFNTYLITLMIANIASVIIGAPLDIWTALDPSIRSDLICGLILYSSWTMYSWVEYTHLTITLIRLLAVMFPIAYKNHHTKRAAIFICVTVFVFCNVMTLPYIVRDRLYFNSPKRRSCYGNQQAQAVYAQLLNAVMFLLPPFAIVALCPVILMRERWRQRSRQRAKVNPHQVTNGTTEQRRKEKSGESHGMRVMVLMTLLILLFWVPPNIYLMPFTEGYRTHLVEQLMFASLMVPAVLDPIMFVITIKDLRTSVTACCRTRTSSAQA